MVKMLLEQECVQLKHEPASSTLMKSISENEYTALHWFCSSPYNVGNAMETLDILLKHADEKDLVAVTNKGETLLMLAVTRKFVYLRI